VTLSDWGETDGSGECLDPSLNVFVRDLELGWVMVPGTHKAEVDCRPPSS
jgi:hypothetical protein